MLDNSVDVQCWEGPTTTTTTTPAKQGCGIPLDTEPIARVELDLT